MIIPIRSARIGGACAAGSTVQSVNADGSVNCQTTHPNPGSITKTVDNGLLVGSYSSIAIGKDGFPIISYYDADNFNLKVAHCNDPWCDSATITVLDSATSIGTDTSIAINSIWYEQISYRDNTNQDLKTAYCSNVE